MEREMGWVRVDVRAFEKVLNDIGKTKVDVSTGIGRSKNYISNSLHEGRFSKATQIALKSVFNISVEEYELVEKGNVAANECDKKNCDGSALDYDRLYETIYNATLDALRKNDEETLGRRFSD